MDFRALSQMELATQPFPSVQYDFRIFIDEGAFDRICNNADDSREVGGILVGDVWRDENGPFIRVDDIIEALHAEESGTELTITHATWNHIHEQMDTIHTGKRILGWYHTHPNFGIFLSDRDQFIQQSFFNLPFQIALVYDPVRRVHGIFSWRDSKPWRVRQYWIGARQHIWDDPRETSEPPELKPLTDNKASDPDPAVNRTQPTVGDQLGNSWVLAAALMGILLGLALGLTWKRNPAQTANQGQVAQEAVASLLAMIARDLAAQHAFMGDLYVQLARDAARNGDRPRVSELLKRAAAVHPEGRTTYEQQIKAFEEQGTLPQPAETNNQSQAQGQPPQ